MTWFVAKVRAGAELALATRLIEAGIDTYVPIAKRLKRPAGCRRPYISSETAAYPGYLFLREITPEIREDSRFHGFLQSMDGDEPYLMDDAGIDEIRTLEALGAFQARESKGPVFVVGMRIKVPHGLCKGLTGIVEASMHGWVTLSGLDFKVPMKLPALILSPETA